MQTATKFNQLAYGNTLRDDIQRQVKDALGEDIGSGDITAMLIPDQAKGKAQVISREPAMLCGQAWVNEVFRQLDGQVEVKWFADDGQLIEADQPVFELNGSLRQLLTGERTALNFLQCLSATASLCHDYAKRVAHTSVKLLDTRKTIPGLRTAQKYAVTIGGCHNHRIGLYDAFLIKENHITACGGIKQAAEQARLQSPGKPIEIEVETMAELEQALEAAVDIVMLDNFSLEQMQQAVTRVNKQCKLEASGNVNLDNLVAIAETGVDYISIGALTKNVRAIDLSMRIL